MKKTFRENAGYRIIKSEIYHQNNNGDTFEIVLGFSQQKKTAYVTWECTNGINYFWGHYMNNEIQAKKDYHQRLFENYNSQITPFLE